jgi:hypothetical protein
MNLILDLLMDPSSDGVALRYHVSPVSPRLGSPISLVLDASNDGIGDADRFDGHWSTGSERCAMYPASLGSDHCAR